MGSFPRESVQFIESYFNENLALSVTIPVAADVCCFGAFQHLGFSPAVIAKGG